MQKPILIIFSFLAISAWSSYGCLPADSGLLAGAAQANFYWPKQGLKSALPDSAVERVVLKDDNSVAVSHPRIKKTFYGKTTFTYLHTQSSVMTPFPTFDFTKVGPELLSNQDLQIVVVLHITADVIKWLKKNRRKTWRGDVRKNIINNFNQQIERLVEATLADNNQVEESIWSSWNPLASSTEKDLSEAATQAKAVKEQTIRADLERRLTIVLGDRANFQKIKEEVENNQNFMVIDSKLKATSFADFDAAVIGMKEAFSQDQISKGKAVKKQIVQK
jgi:hypothetical protein